MGKGVEGRGEMLDIELDIEGTTTVTSHVLSIQSCVTFPRQEIKVGPTHQAVVPDHPTFPPYAKGKPQDNLLWSPRHTTEERGREEGREV